MADLVEFWINRHEAADEYRKMFESRWIRNWQLYRNTGSTVATKGQSWRSNAMLPDAYRVIETMLPQHIMGMFRNPQWFSVEAPTFPGETYQRIVHSLLLHGWRKADMYRKTISGFRVGHVLGHQCPKVTWQVEIGEREVLDLNYEFTESGERVPAGFKRTTIPDVKHNGPQVHMPDLFNLWQDPTGNEQWWIERIPSSLDELKQSNKQFGGTLYSNLSKIESETAMSRALNGRRSYGLPDENTLAEIVEGIPQQYAPDHVLLWQCWGYVPPSVKRYEDTQWRLQIIANKSVLIRDVPIPTHDHRPPYLNVPSHEIVGQIYGDSVLSYIGDIIELRSQIENMRRDEVLLNIYGTYAIDGSVQIRGQDLFKMPGGALKIMLDEGKRLQDVIMPMPRTPVLPEAYNESAIKERQMLDASGATEPFQGTAFGGRTTATEVNLIANLGTSRFALATMVMDEIFKKRVLTRFFKLYQSRLTTPEIVQLAGEPGVQDEIDFSDLQYDVDIFVDSGLFGSLDQQQFNALLQTYQVMLTNPETAVWIDPAKFVRKITYRAGINDDFLRSPDEVAQIMEAQRQREFEQAVLSGMGAGPSQAAPR